MSASSKNIPNTQNPNQNENEAGQGQPVRVDGFNQVLEMLRVADPEFRESLLRRLGQRDPSLAMNLRRDLRDMGL